MNSGKGDVRRPSDVSEEEVADNWELIFGREKEDE